ncbi:MAG: hypothetical protein JWM24_824 [Solirubrobacterales bacterium]|nr:hypothetical protein [Solirubrobacterales bacterium]
MKRLGPELKKPDLKSIDLKVPTVARDLYQDLRDRRLLPLVALILVAIAAVPVLLSGSGSGSPAAPIAEGQGPTPAAAASNASLTVVKAAPGLREPGKRLSRLRAKDPFRQHYTNAPVTQEATPVETAISSTVASETSTTEVVAEETVETPSGETGGSSPGSSGNSGNGNGEGSPGKGGLVFYAFAVDVKIVRTETKPDGSKESSELPTRERVLPATSLPGDKQQVVTYMGISPKTRKPLFLVSTDVSAVFGDARCVAGSDSCQLLELEEKLPETFMYGANDVRYKLTVLKIEPVVTGRS